ncbi:hypothetical protein BC835DRAFT_1375888 [Cytidiella melzeri]|nr:hypothetical protein BC835DRAFT_1375888 [Cytidiella melzeri]
MLLPTCWPCAQSATAPSNYSFVRNKLFQGSGRILGLSPPRPKRVAFRNLLRDHVGKARLFFPSSTRLGGRDRDARPLQPVQGASKAPRTGHQPRENSLALDSGGLVLPSVHTHTGHQLSCKFYLHVHHPEQALTVPSFIGRRGKDNSAK